MVWIPPAWGVGLAPDGLIVGPALSQVPGRCQDEVDSVRVAQPHAAYGVAWSSHEISPG